MKAQEAKPGPGPALTGESEAADKPQARDEHRRRALDDSETLAAEGSTPARQSQHLASLPVPSKKGNAGADTAGHRPDKPTPEQTLHTHAGAGKRALAGMSTATASDQVRRTRVRVTCGAAATIRGFCPADGALAPVRGRARSCARPGA